MAVSIPREQWPAHENYPAHVLLLGSHSNFRRISEHLVETASRSWGEDEHSSMIIECGWLYRRWIGAMRSHEAYEEAKLYPYLARRWNTSLDAAADGHDELHRADDAVRAALAGGDREALAAAFARHDEVLVRHLAIEEDLVIPMLLALEPAEFADYTRRDIASLLASLESEGG